MMFSCFLVVFGSGFFIGVVVCIGLEALGFYYLINRLNRKIEKQQQQSSHASVIDLDHRQSLDYAYCKKGLVWVLEGCKVPKSWSMDEVTNGLKKKEKVFEVTPVRKHATIKDHSLVLTDPDASCVSIMLKGCTIEAVSASNFPSRKWSKRFPTKIENKTSALWNGCKTVYIYFETSWEKEAWCKALRLASCMDEEQIKWFTKLKEEFRCYLASLSVGYPTFMRPSPAYHAEPMGRVDRLAGSTSKVRTFFKKFSRKTSKASLENRGTLLSGHEERKISDRFYLYEDPFLACNSYKNSVSSRPSCNSDQRDLSLNSSSTLSRSTSQTQMSVTSDSDCDERFCVDEGTLSWNLIISRLFFDAKSTAEIKRSVQARIQRTLSNMRTPSFVHEVLCTDVDLGNLPPYILGTRVLATEMNEVWAWEVDIEYRGGLVLDFETRLVVGDQNLQKGTVDISSKSSSVVGVSAELREGFEYFGSQLNISEGSIDETEKRDERYSRSKGSKNYTNGTTTPTRSRWKAIVNSIAKQVSQVPISLSVRVSSLRGTLRLHIKPPPSDQLWYGFTSMPDIEFNLESAVGEHKITSARVAMLLISRFKASIRETMVLPNIESVCISWMLAEKNDWAPRKVAPFLWVNHETSSDHAAPHDAFGSRHHVVNPNFGAVRRSLSEHPDRKHQRTRSSEAIEQTIMDASDAVTSSLSPKLKLSMQNRSLQDLRTPLLTTTEPQEPCRPEGVDNLVCESPSTSAKHFEEKDNNTIEADESISKKMNRRARMLDLRKKMSMKLEEKRRHIEEKGRNIVEKMRGPQSLQNEERTAV